MKKLFNYILLIFIVSLNGYAQSPGGIATPSVWIKSGVQTITSLSTTGLINSGSIGNFTTIGAAATLNTTTNLVNYNPKIVFDGASSRYSIANPYAASTSITDFAVGVTENTATYGTLISGDANYFGLAFQNSGTNDLTAWRALGATNADVGNVYGIFGIAQPNGTASDNRRTINGLESTYLDAAYAGTDGGSICIGSSTTGGANYYDGDIYEIIEYTSALSTANMIRVNSYLALKYGISLNNTVSYVSSAGTTFWDAAGTNTGYENNIFGIGTDNAGSGLRVAQAKSYPNGHLAVYKGTLQVLNKSNTSLDAVADGNFVMFGSNGLTGFVAHTYGSDATVNARSAEVWKLQVTGAAITSFNVNTASGFPGGTPKYVMISADPTFAAGVTYYAITGNAATNITVPATGQYMAIALSHQSPGGIINPTVWIKAGSQTATSMSTTGLINSGSIGDLTTIGSAATLNSTTNLVNYHPKMVFDGAASRYSITNPYAASTSITDFAVGVTEKTTTYGTLISGDDNYFGLAFQNSGTNDLTAWRTAVATNADVANVYGIFGIAQPNGTASDNRRTINGLESTYLDAAYAGTDGGSICIGSSSTGGANYYDGDIYEIIEYTSALSTANMIRVNSYLALKYGISLNNTVSYVSSAGTTFWDAAGTNTGYENNIFGIGTDNLGSGLRQAQSKSYPNGTIAVYKGTLQTLNSSNTGLDAVADGNFVMFGSNGLVGTAAHTYVSDANVNARSAEIWKLQVTGAGITSFNVNTSECPGIPLYVMISADPTFAAGVTYYAITNNAATNITVPATGQYMAIALFKNNPGGISSPTVWIKSGSQTAESMSTTGLINSGSIGDLTTIGGAATLNSTTDLVNYNPKMVFDGAASRYSITNPYAASTSITDFAVGVTEKTSTYGTFISGDDNYFGLAFQNSGTNDLTAWRALGATNADVGNVYGIFGIAQPNGTASDNRRTINGLESTYPDAAYAGTDGGSICIGSSTTGGANYYDGDIYEIIEYTSALSTANMIRVNSYLALKFGISLNNTVSYVSSAGTTFWDATGTNTGYENHIFGIGTDFYTGSGIRVAQSKNYPNGHLAVYKGTLQTLNSSNTALDAVADGNFVMFGSNGLTGFVAHTYGSDATVNARSAEVWKLQVTGAAITSFNVNTASGFTGGTPKYVMISADPTFAAGVTYYAITGDAATNITVPATGQYMAIAMLQQSPGGITGAATWLKADNGVTSGGDGTDVTLWTDATGNGYNVSQSTVGDQPEYYTTTAAKLINFNPTIDFTNNELLENNTPLLAATSAYSFIAVATDESTSTGYNTLYACDDVTNDWSFYKQGGATGDNGWNMWISGTGPHETNKRAIGFSPTGGANGYYNGVNYTSNSNTQRIQPQIAAITGTISGVVYPISYIDGYAYNAESFTNTDADYFQMLGIGAEVSCSNCEPWTGRIPEFIAYGSQLTAAQMIRVNSYVAIKYGITLGQGGTNPNIFANDANYNYQASDASVIWDATTNTTYKWHIAGIGRDDVSGLDQEQSQSQNAGFQPIIGNASEITTSNAVHSGSFSADKSFEVWGCDGASTNFTTAFAFGTCTYRMTRVWKITETGTVGTVKVAAKLCDLPSVSSPYLVVSGNATFDGADTRTAMTKESIGGEYYYTATVNFTDGQYFTFAGFIASPGGVNTNIEVWLKGDGCVTSSGNGTDVTEWLDASGNGYDVEQTTVGDRPEYYSTTAAKLMNFNPTIDYTNNELLENNTPLMAATSAYSFIAVATDESTSTGYNTLYACDDVTNDWSFYKQGGATGDNGWNMWISGTGPHETNSRAIGFSPSGGSNGFYNGVNYTSNASTQIIQPQISSITGTISGVVYPISYIDGYAYNSQEFTNTDADYFQMLGIGAEVSCSGCEPWTGRIPEFIAYSNQLSAAEMKRVNSYLAIKYGITLGQGGTNPNIFANDNNYDYQLSDATVIWDATTNNSYKWHISGIARDDDSGLNQKISKSSNAGSADIVVISLDNDFTSANNDAGRTNAFNSDLSALVWGSDNAATVFGTTYNTSIDYRMTRKWQIQQTNFTDSVYVNITDADIDNNSQYALIANTTSAETGWTQLSSATSESTGNTITFGPFTFDNNNFFSVSTLITPLPIELLDFQAVLNSKTVTIFWETASEKNNDYYTVERSVDGIHFETIATIPSKAKGGNSTSMLSYNLNDDDVTTPGVYYYRLKQTDYDGKYTYSKIDAVVIKANSDFKFNIAPNPNNGAEFNLIINAEKHQEIVVVIRNVLGQELYTKVIITEQDGDTVYAIDLDQRLNAGVYFITATSNQEVIGKRLIVN